MFGEAKPLLSDWMKEKMRDDIIRAFMAFPSESAQTNLGSDAGETVNGKLYETNTETDANTWVDGNADRILYGNAVGNLASVSHATDMAKIDTTSDKFTSASVSLLKRTAMLASPAIRPYKTPDGYEYYICFAGTNTFRDLKSNMATNWQNAQPRESKDGNPLFQDGDIMFDGVIVRQVPEISSFVTDVWTSMTTAGASSTRVEPVFFCGKQALAVAYGQMAKPTFRKEDDYGFVQGVGIEAAYGAVKMFKKHPMTGSNLVQWGVATGFYSAALDA